MNEIYSIFSYFKFDLNVFCLAEGQHNINIRNQQRLTQGQEVISRSTYLARDGIGLDLRELVIFITEPPVTHKVKVKGQSQG